MRLLRNVRGRFVIISSIVLIGSIVLTVFAYRMTILTRPATSQTQLSPTPSLSMVTPTMVPTSPLTPTPYLTPTPTPVPPVNPSRVLGINGGPPSLYPGIFWTRIGYKTCGSDLTGDKLRTTVQYNHVQGVHVLLLLCQQPGPRLLNMQLFNDVAQAGADAVECGNEQMKHNTYPTYVSPKDFARFYDLCERMVHAVRPGIPVLLGSLDPHVGGVDYGPLYDQVGYLNEMESAMNSTVHPGGHWSWRAQTVGLIDSWHNGYPNQSVNSLLALFGFWAQQFGVDLNSGGLGKHLWVVEGTGCISGCGLYSDYQVAVAHILTLITDVETAKRYHVPIFYFSGQDFVQGGYIRPVGIVNLNGHPKPLRQDLSLGAKTLTLSCATGQVNVIDQERLLAKLYSGCTLPGDYVGILAS